MVELIPMERGAHGTEKSGQRRERWREATKGSLERQLPNCHVLLESFRYSLRVSQAIGLAVVGFRDN